MATSGKSQAVVVLTQQLKGEHVEERSTDKAHAPRVVRSACSRAPIDLVARSTLAELSKRPVEGFSAGPADESNIFLWDIMIMGPPGTP